MQKVVKHRSVIPVYGIAAAAVIWALFFPLYTTAHFVLLCAVCAAVFIGLSFLTTKTETVVLPVPPPKTGDEQIDALIAEGHAAVSELITLAESITDSAVKEKTKKIIAVTEKIFSDAADDHADYRQVRRFADLFLPPVQKLINEYVKAQNTGSGGETIRNTMNRISSALDSVINSYEKFLDALYANQALDIETDIQVLEQILKRDGLN